MIYKNKILNLKKNLIKIKKYKKNEFKKIIYKSIIQNKNIKPKIRSFSFYKMLKLKYNYSLSKQNNCCMYTGKIKSIFNKYKMSRHFIKKMFLDNELKNNKIINW